MKTTIFRRLTSGFLAVPILAVLLTSCGAEDPVPQNPAPSNAGKTQRVEVAVPSYRSFVAEVLISGTAEPNRQVMLHARESGYVEKVLKDIGDPVKKGDVIAELANPELYRQRQQLTAEVEGKKSIYERLLATYEKTPALTPLQLLDEAKAAYFSQKAELDAVNDRISFLRVKAPFAGIVTQRFVDEGALVQNGLRNARAMPLFEVQEVSVIRLCIPLPETDAGSVGLGMAAVITFPELPGASYSAIISRTSNSLDRDSKTMQVEIDLQNAEGKIKPGMYAKALMQLSSRDSVLSLPVTAQVIKQNQPFVFVVSDNIVYQVELRKGLSNKDYFEVLNSEIAADAQVIVQGKGLVKAGDTVEAVVKND
jgi:RND family efflux transporter MFP subunit